MAKQSDDEFYTMEAIKGYKKVKGIDYFLIKWEGYPDTDNTWEPEDNILVPTPEIVAQMQSFRESQPYAKSNARPSKRRRTLASTPPSEPPENQSATRSANNKSKGAKAVLATEVTTSTTSDPTFVPSNTSSSSEMTRRPSSHKSREHINVIRLLKCRRAQTLPLERIRAAAEAGLPAQALSIMVTLSIQPVDQPDTEAYEQVVSLVDAAVLYQEPLLRYFLQKIKWLRDENEGSEEQDLVPIVDEADKENIPP